MKTTIVIVVYKAKLDDSKTFKSLISILNNEPSLTKNISIVIYDNSPELQELPMNHLNCNILYKHDPRNLGLATAYDFAYQHGMEKKSEWLLLLDHDTTLNKRYLDEILNVSEINRNEIAAVVPIIECKDTIVSPVKSNTILPLKEERPTPGIQNDPVMAINSGALMNIEFIHKIGGFNNEFPLDYLDHWLFYKIYETGYKALVLDVTLQHELSVMDFNSVSYARYKSILDSEINFYKNYKKQLYPAYKKLMIKRIIKQFLVGKNKKIAVYTLRKLYSN